VSASPRVALLRGFWLNNFEMQNYAPLQEMGFALTAYATRDHIHEIGLVDMPVEVLAAPRALGRNLPKIQGLVDRALRARNIGELWPRDVRRIAAGCDILHAAETYNLFSYQAALAKRRAGCKLVLTIWENVPFVFEDQSGVRAVKQTVMAETDLYLAATERARVVLRLEGVPDERIRVIWCGVDREAFRPGPRDPEIAARMGIAPGDFVVLAVTQLLALKGVTELLCATKLLKDRGTIPNLRVVVVGEGPLRGELEARRARLGLDGTFLMPGKFSYADMGRVHSVADVFTLPSIPQPTWQEQFGHVLSEAMACGKAVVSTHCGSIPDVLADTGLLVQPADALSLADAIERLAADTNLRRELGERALARAADLFDSRRVAGRIAECYRELLG
jgi:starch synthase